MLKCIAIDDEPLALRQLQGYIAKINFLKLEKAFTNAIEAQQYLAGNPIDLIFVDINMPDLSGVEFVRSLVSRPMIIFTTAYSEYAVEGFKLDAIDYLLKPFSFADFSRSAAKAQSLYELLAYRKTQGNAPAPEATPRDREYISIKADYKATLVRISDIVYLGKRRRIRTAPSGRPIDHHDSFPAQEHGSGPAVGNVHAGPSLLHRQSTTYQELRKRPGFRKRQRIHPHRRELPGNVPTVHRNPLPESITENRVRNLEEKSYPSRNGHSTARQQTTKRDHMLSGYLWEANIWRCVIKAHCYVIIGMRVKSFTTVNSCCPCPHMPRTASILTPLKDCARHSPLSALQTRPQPADKPPRIRYCEHGITIYGKI